ncbi:D-alanyl-D-alanine carboxypeptidase/D-alanyl-D-alanine endopeptidase [Nigerium massiliense]|uniref:D-alanyl-D-alanine carboxypeptidase/D-alanyl-D-alanine endopeptidase n=1 Tax=Nigerium massiliense TaxID=1522317 RepID=UPI000694198A|nr:D-alanyl-D-alanine carboxypeptidase/D-alanyl-D-alanine-endopeptidase [Nigerium massiliense]
MTALKRVLVAAVAASLTTTLVLSPATPGWTAPGGRSGPLPVADTLPPAVLEGVQRGLPRNPAVVGQRISAIKKDGLPSIGAMVLNRDGEIVYQAGNTPKTPASTMKVLTSVVALDVLGAESRLQTTVVQGRAINQIALVGGGDPLLQSTADRRPGAASLDRLAAATAAKLKAKKVATVSLTLDATLFSGPAWNADWPQQFQWSVAPITALKVDNALSTPGSLNRDKSPVDHAGRAFVAALAARGIKVTATNKGKAVPGTETLASVSSPPISAIVEHTLSESDNDAAETLAFLVSAKRGKAASFADSRAVLTDELTRRGLFDPGMFVADGNGISTRNRITPGVLARAIRQGVEDPNLRYLLTGLPVAGVTGTLAGRFQEPTMAPGRGRVRGKTGSIASVDGLAGYVTSKDGERYSFAFVLNGAPSEARGRQWIDQAASVLANCGC